MSSVTSAIGLIGLTPIARRYEIQPSAVIKWRDQGRLPSTELSGLTDYASGIAELSRSTEKPVTREQLLNDTRVRWTRKKRGAKPNGKRRAQ